MTLQGESGRGKSTLLHALIHEEPQVELVGQVTLDGQCMDMSVRLSECAQTVFQDPMLFSHLSVGANIALSMHRFPRSKHERRVNALLNQLGLDGMAKGGSISFVKGSNDACSCHSSLAPHPRVLLLDDCPFSAAILRPENMLRQYFLGR